MLHARGMGTHIEISPDTMVALAGRLRALGSELADVERFAGDGAAASGDPAVGLALSSFDDSWDHNRGVLASDLLAGADALDRTVQVFREQDQLLAELIGDAGRQDSDG